MERVDAERVFTLVAEFNGDLRGRIVSERWWLVWIATGWHMLIGSAILQAMLWRGESRTPVLVAVLAGFALILLLLIRFIHRHAGGQRTATEAYLWWIWASHILCTLIVPPLEVIAGLPAFSLIPVFALLSAFAFSMMAMITDRLFLVHAAFFVAAALGMGCLRDYQFLLYGGAWFVVLETLGLYYRLRHTPRAGRRL